MSTAPLERAVSLAGSQSALAQAASNVDPDCRIKQQHISYWLRKGRLPAEHCSVIEAAVNGAVTKHELRPDIFGQQASVA